MPDEQDEGKAINVRIRQRGIGTSQPSRAKLSWRSFEMLIQGLVAGVAATNVQLDFESISSWLI